MRIKKFIAGTLVFVLFASSVSQGAMAAGNMSVGTGNITYSGGSVNLQYFMSGNIPTLQGIPMHSSMSDAFYSDQGCFKLNIDDPNCRRLFEDGAKVEVRFANKPAPVMHLNPFNGWDKFLSYSPAEGSDVNRLSIKGPQIKDGVPLSKLLMIWRTFPGATKGILRALVSIIPAYFIGYKVTDLVCNLVKQSIWKGKGPSALGYAPTVAGVLTWLNCANPDLNNDILNTLKGLIKPAINLKNVFIPSQKSSTVDFKYGVVLTDRDDEKSLLNNIEPIPKEGDLDPDYAISEEQQKKAKIALREKLSKIQDPAEADKFRAKYPRIFDDDDLKLLTKEKAKKIADDRKLARAKAQRKLAEARPITEGLVCVLDADHPEQTFRLVMNNNLGGHDADLFSMALNSGADLTSTGKPDKLLFNVTHVLPSSAGAEAIRNRAGNILDVATASDKDQELMKKVTTIVNTTRSDVKDFVDWFGKILSSIFSFSNQPLPGVPGPAVVAAPAGGGAPGVPPAAPAAPAGGGAPVAHFAPSAPPAPDDDEREGTIAVLPPEDEQQQRVEGLRQRHVEHLHNE